MTATRTAIFVRADDGRVVTRLRDVAERKIDVTVFAGSQDRRARRLAAAADAELGAISPDAHLPVVLCPDGPPRGGIVGALILVVPTADGTAWQVLYPDGRIADAIDGIDPEAIDAARASGATLGPVGTPPSPTAPRLDGLTAIHVASVPKTIDGARLPATVAVIRSAGGTVDVLTVPDTATRAGRIRAGWQLVRRAAIDGPDVLHVHDPELLPAATFAAVRGRCTVIYEARGDLRATARTREWIPRLIRRPFAHVAGRLENILAARVSAVLTTGKAAAITFASRGGDAVCIADPEQESAKLIALYGRLTGRID